MKNNTQNVKWAQIMLCILTFMVARVEIVGYYTVGMSFLGVVSKSKELRRWASVFALLGIVSTTTNLFHIAKYILIIVFLECIAWIIKGEEDEKSLSYQLLHIGGALFLGGIVSALALGGGIYGIVLAIVEATIGTSLSAVLKSGVKVIGTKRKTPLTQKEGLSMILLCSLFLAGFIDFYIQVPYVREIYFKDIIAFMILIGVTHLAGVHKGLTLGVVISSVLVLIGYMPSHFALIYSFFIMVQGIFVPVGRLGEILGGGLALVLGFLLFNKQIIDYQIVGAYMVAGVGSICIPKTYFGFNTWFGYEMTKEKDEEHLLRIQHVMADRMKEFVGVFSRLSTGFSNMQFETPVLGEKEKKAVIEEVGRKLCMNCSMQKFCWQQDVGKTYEGIYEMIDTLSKKGEIVLRDIPDSFQKNCIQAENFAYMLQLRLELYKQEILWKNKIVEHEVLVGKQLETIVKMMEKSIRQVEERVCFNNQEEERVKEDLLARGVKVKDLLLIENNKGITEIRIQTESCHKDERDLQKIIKSIKENLELKVEASLHKCDDEGCTYHLNPAKKFHVSCSAVAMAKESISGDVHTFMELKDGQYLLALADGMGSGYEAKEESTATIEMLEDFMEAGFNEDLAIELINASLILKNNTETFSTIDITLIDCYTGIARFIKAGASTSFLLRNGEVTVIRSNSFPIGILREIDIHSHQLQLKQGDLLVMVTDGMLATKEDVLGKEETFKHFITQVMEADPEYIAHTLMEKSKNLLVNEEKDDMTIMVAKIWQKY